MENISPQLTTELPGRLYPGIMAVTYLLAIGLTEALTAWIEPFIGLILYSVILLALLSESAFDPEYYVRRLCLALTPIPLIRVVGFSIPQDGLHPLSQYFLLSVALVIATGLAMYYLALRPGQIGLGFGQETWRIVAYFPVVLIALPMGLIEYQLLKLPPVINLLASSTTTLQNINPTPWAAGIMLGDPVQPTFVIEIVSLCLSLVEVMIFFGILLHVSRDLFGDWASVFYVALLFSLLQSGQFSWEYGLFIFVSSIIFGRVVLKTQTLYPAMLVYGFAKIVLLAAPALLADGPSLNRIVGVIAPLDIALGAIFSAMLLIAFLTLKELASATAVQSNWRVFARSLNISLVPLLITFFITVGLRILTLIH